MSQANLPTLGHMMSKNKKIFEDLFVLEIANNHWGNMQRGFKLIEEFGKVVRQNNVKAAIKLQIRDVDNFVHKDFQNRKDNHVVELIKAFEYPNMLYLDYFG